MRLRIVQLVLAAGVAVAVSLPLAASASMDALCVPIKRYKALRLLQNDMLFARLFGERFELSDGHVIDVRSMTSFCVIDDGPTGYLLVGTGEEPTVMFSVIDLTGRGDEDSLVKRWRQSGEPNPIIEQIASQYNPHRNLVSVSRALP